MNLRRNFGEGLIVGAAFTTAVIVAAEPHLRFAELLGGLASLVAGLILVYGGKRR